MMFVTSITIDQVIDMLADFLQPYCLPAEIVRAQSNRVAMPSSPCVVLTELFTTDLETPDIQYFPGDDLARITSPKKIDIQIDFYGEEAMTMCGKVKSVFRTLYATNEFSGGISPLYCSDGIQHPLITGEQQYEKRWTVTASVQYNPAVDVPQQFADEASVGIVPVDLIYPLE